MTYKSDNAEKSVRVYFENLNAIRFIAASLVVVHHIEQFKNIFKLNSSWNNAGINNMGKLGVVLFFVLSGFLISYLLFKEKEVTNSINVKKFYMRRILRIWPLYFLIVIAAFFIFPFIDYLSIPGYGKDVVWDNILYKIIFYVLMLPNVVLAVIAVVPFASHLWSIGTEEQFYLVWPVLNKKIKNKWLLMFAVVFFYIIIKIILRFSHAHAVIGMLQSIWATVPIDCMAIGGMFALIAYQDNVVVNKIRKVLFSRVCQWSVLLVTIYFLVTGFRFNNSLNFFHYEFYSILFGVIILNFAVNKNRIFSMENKFFNYLGKISYGIYMFHSIVIVLAIKICIDINYMNNYVLYPLVFIFMIFVSSFSYEFFEKRFIKMKVKYSDIISGENT